MNLYLQVSLLEENIKPRTDLPPLLVHLRERRPEKLHYLGVSFGLTLDLFRFWKKHKFAPFYICQIPVKMIFPLLVSFPHVRLYVHYTSGLEDQLGIWYFAPLNWNRIMWRVNIHVWSLNHWTVTILRSVDLMNGVSSVHFTKASPLWAKNVFLSMLWYVIPAWFYFPWLS